MAMAADEQLQGHQIRSEIQDRRDLYGGRMDEYIRRRANFFRARIYDAGVRNHRTKLYKFHTKNPFCLRHRASDDLSAGELRQTPLARRTAPGRRRGAGVRAGLFKGKGLGKIAGEAFFCTFRI